jgi:hypothetical protein
VEWLLVLLVLWGAVLIPPWLADRCRDRPVQTMASFHRRLQQLEQLEQAPYASESLALDSAGHRFVGRAGRSAHVSNVAQVAHVAHGGHADGALYGDVELADDGFDVGVGDEVDDDELLGEPDARADAAGASRTALRRRRQIFFSLLSAVVLSLVALVALRSVSAVAVHGASLVMFTTYVTLLVRHHQRATERVSKVRYLSPIREPRPAVVVLRSGTAR